ncbi:MAG: hypothetical protein RDU20_16590 [Desulfomonilaceae bacterium]|nr:hypothetical protein [Desulfomonilaceae bacterium]
MKITRNSVNKLLAALVLLGILIASSAQGERLYAPDYLWRNNIAEKTDPIDIANTHLRIPYREDGALDDQGRFTTFNSPDQLFDTPGLNCSGLVLSVSRFLFNKNWSLEDVTKDPQGNSGPNSSLGKDWDFGLDLILNLTEGTRRKIVTPSGAELPLESVDGLTTRGFDLHDAGAWRNVLAQMRPGHAYFGSISKPTTKPGYKVLHYHVVLMLPADNGEVWLYHSTQRSNVHRMNINSPNGLHRLMSQFRTTRTGGKSILIVETDVPKLDAVAETESDESPRADGPTPAGSEQAASGREPSEPEPSEESHESAAPRSEARADAPPHAPRPPQRQDPGLVIEHRSGKVYQPHPELVSHIPKFTDKGVDEVLFWFRNREDRPRELEVALKSPAGETHYRGTLPGRGKDLSVVFPRDFDNAASLSVREGRYLAEVKIDGRPWSANLFEVTVPREAEPRIVEVRVPRSVRSGETFTVTVTARNTGAESDYGGITVSSPDPSGLQIASVKPGTLYGRGSTVLSVTSDKIHTKVPMAERWINLWGEGTTYDMNVRVKAGRPGTYPLYVRCALRGVNVKSSVVLMDPKDSDTVDQQGFPVKVYRIAVQ